MATLGDAFQQAQDLGLAPNVDTTANAWQSFSFIDIILFITVIVAVAFGVAAAMARDVALPVAASAITAGLGILSTILIVYRLIDTPGAGGRSTCRASTASSSASSRRSAIAYGGWVGMQEEGTSFGARSTAFRAAASGGTGADSAPAAPSGDPPPEPRRLRRAPGL